jgi:hypothetical protein
MKCYKSFDELYFDDEIKDILSDNDVIHIKYDPNKKDIIFLLGILFASGKRIQVDNLNDVKDDGSLITTLVKHWHNNKASLQLPTGNNFVFNSFFIYPINQLEDKEGFRIREIVEQERKKGYGVTTSGFISDSAYGLCKQNAIAIANSNNIYMHYSSKSRASMFDLGMVYYFSSINRNRTFRLLNEGSIKLDYNDFGDRVVSKMLEDQRSKDNIYNKLKQIS